LEILVKERLTGAIILVVLIVLLVPELLSGPSRSAPASQVAAPSSSSEEPPLRSYTIDLANESRGTSPSAGTSNVSPQPNGPEQPSTIVEHPAQDPSTAQQAPAAGSVGEASPQESPQQAAQAVPPVVAHSASQPKEPAQAPRPAPTAAEKHPSTGGWVVQVGVFAKQANAERLVRELQEQGFRTSISENSSGGRTLWWVRTAPVAERAAAEQLSARLRAAGHVGSIVPK
jgi:cell division septation protein DedD